MVIFAIRVRMISKEALAMGRITVLCNIKPHPYTKILFMPPDFNRSMYSLSSFLILEHTISTTIQSRSQKDTLA